MKMKIYLSFALLCLFSVTARAQWVVTDPSNLAQGIVNSINQMVHTSSTATNMLNSFQETVKIYQQAKGYYDQLKAVNNLVKDARKVQQSLLMLGEITDIYVNNYGKMLNDKYLSVAELNAIAFGYVKILQQGTDALVELKEIINPTSLSMTDKERIDIIDRVYRVMVKNRDLANYYTRKNIQVSLLRAKAAQDRESVMQLYDGDEKYW